MPYTIPHQKIGLQVQAIQAEEYHCRVSLHLQSASAVPLLFRNCASEPGLFSLYSLESPELRNKRIEAAAGEAGKFIVAVDSILPYPRAVSHALPSTPSNLNLCCPRKS